MSIITVQVTGVDGQALWCAWGPMNSGDEGSPLSIYSFSGQSWQFTGWDAGNINNPNVPVMPDRSFMMYGSNDSSCWAPMWNMQANPAGMNSRMGDPVRDGSNDQRFRFLKPMMLGLVNPAGPDCSIMLFAYRK